LDRTRILRTELEFKFKRKKTNGRPRRRWFGQIQEDIKRGKSWQEIVRKSGKKD
jgi:hypothetical protein